MKRLSPNDATLVAARTKTEWLLFLDKEETDAAKKDAIMMRWAEVARLIENTPADTQSGLIAKAQSILDEIVSAVADGDAEIHIGGVESLCNDLLRLFGGNVVPLRPAPSGGDAA